VLSNLPTKKGKAKRRADLWVALNSSEAAVVV
jgi:hypothetical protein